MGIILWMHGVTVGMVYEGQKGLLNRFLWTFIIIIIPVSFLTPSNNTRMRRFAGAWVYFETCTFIMCYSNSLAWYRNPKKLKSLPDIGHDLLPESWISQDTEKIPDIIMVTLIISTFFFAIAHRKSWDIFRRFFLIYGTLCIMRSVTVIVTSLPDSSLKCRMMTPTGNLLSGASTWENITWKDVIIRSLKLLVPVGEVTCGDMVFSGHSILMVLCAMTWHTYYKWVPSSINFVKVGIWILAFMGMLSIIWTRMHYTIDVILALYFAVTIWSSYHRYVNDITIGYRFSSVWIIDDLLIYPAIEWFEADAFYVEESDIQESDVISDEEMDQDHIISQARAREISNEDLMNDRMDEATHFQYESRYKKSNLKYSKDHKDINLTQLKLTTSKASLKKRSFSPNRHSYSTRSATKLKE